MKRTFNYTNRRLVRKGDVKVTLKEEVEGLAFDARIDLSKYDFPSDANVWLEAHRMNTWMSFACGKARAGIITASGALSEFDVADGILFRLRVVESKPNGPLKLLGEADGLHFVKDGDAESDDRDIITPYPDDLGERLWKLDLEAEPPQLLINNKAQPFWKDVAKDPAFIALVYPEVLRQILRLVLETWSADDEQTGWRSDWMTFAKHLVGSDPPESESDDELSEAQVIWLDNVVSEFSRKNRMRSTWWDKKHKV